MKKICDTIASNGLLPSELIFQAPFKKFVRFGALQSSFGAFDTDFGSAESHFGARGVCFGSFEDVFRAFPCTFGALVQFQTDSPAACDAEILKTGEQKQSLSALILLFIHAAHTLAYG
ncbi:hypothetical protein NCCP2331_24270 [Sporosarcina sp. NCCP-2331]|nr:hypothetical protein NCCP2331_24270 [Sporosarcina sp. NCCP-2331]GLB56311.1 hypothetical protein NCCP2378_20980 [Sporosarcina sp. NCCP-2378]